jgi:hypothetical protein
LKLFEHSNSTIAPTITWNPRNDQPLLSGERLCAISTARLFWLSESFDDGEALTRAAEKHGLEGVVS